MRDEQLDDLKQFIESTVSQSEERIKDDLRNDLGAQIQALEKKVDDGFATMSESIDSIHDVLDNHEGRLTSIEQKAF